MLPIYSIYIFKFHLQLTALDLPKFGLKLVTQGRQGLACDCGGRIPKRLVHVICVVRRIRSLITDLSIII